LVGVDITDEATEPAEIGGMEVVASVLLEDWNENLKGDRLLRYFTRDPWKLFFL
jgi:hypothetical protein